ncbi:11136_t:CDS:2 [Dentiscutata erythropus]|uniref:11136_t:CDS:1 n=1 Tax=Dentiscutata erythropus TaxID=1348616 RepID=A0A9N9I7A1_9GLOM|nr:11136_t:CDS:2 [Dentiscutata erythropus]
MYNQSARQSDNAERWELPHKINLALNYRHIKVLISVKLSIKPSKVPKAVEHYLEAQKPNENWSKEMMQTWFNGISLILWDDQEEVTLYTGDHYFEGTQKPNEKWLEEEMQTWFNGFSLKNNPHKTFLLSFYQTDDKEVTLYMGG